MILDGMNVIAVCGSLWADFADFLRQWAVWFFIGIGFALGWVAGLAYAIWGYALAEKWENRKYDERRTLV